MIAYTEVQKTNGKVFREREREREREIERESSMKFCMKLPLGSSSHEFLPVFYVGFFA